MEMDRWSEEGLIKIKLYLKITGRSNTSGASFFCGCVLELQKSLSRSPALALRQPLPVREGPWGKR